MTIEEIRNQLADVNKEITNARAAGIALMNDKTASVAQLQAAQSNLEGLKAKAALLRESLDDETEKQSANLKKMQKGVDAVKSAADRFKSMGDFFSCVAKACNPSNPEIDPRMADYIKVCSDASGQNITTAADGGYLVPPDYSDELVNVAKSESVLFPKVQHVPISGNRLIVNEIVNDSRKDHDASQSIGGRNGGLLAYWTAEAATYTATKMQFAQKQTDLHKLTGLCYATEEMLEDMPAMSAIIANGFADEFTFKIDNAILNGTGNGMPLGILATSETAAQNNAALVTIAKESGQAAATIELNNILKMFNAMPAANRGNAVWLINQDVELVLMQLLMQTGSVASTGESAVEAIKGTVGIPLYVPAGGLASAPNGMLLGRPIIPVEQCAALGSKGDIVFADLSQYRWIDKGGINAQTSMHVRFLYDEQAFKFTYRAGGRPIWSNTISAYTGSTVRSPYVALAARA